MSVASFILQKFTKLKKIKDLPSEARVEVLLDCECNYTDYLRQEERLLDLEGELLLQPNEEY